MDTPQHPEKRKKETRPYFDPGLILLNCAALGDLDGVRKLLSEGVNPTVYNVDRITPLHQVRGVEWTLVCVLVRMC